MLRTAAARGGLPAMCVDGGGAAEGEENRSSVLRPADARGGVPMVVVGGGAAQGGEVVVVDASAGAVVRPIDEPKSHVWGESN